MKNAFVLLCLLTCSLGYTQSLPIHFEDQVTADHFIDFDGGMADVVANPWAAGINTSDSVAVIVRDGGAIWAGSKLVLSAPVDFSVLTAISMKVYTTAPIGTQVKFKLEGQEPFVEADAFTSVSGEWETLEWIFAGTPNDKNELVFMFDFGNVGDGSASSTFYFDDISQVAGPPAPEPASLPLDFESGTLTSDFQGFAGGMVTVIDNPEQNAENMSNTVGQLTRAGGEYWAGSFILLEENLDLSSLWHMSMKLFTEAPVGTLIKLELQGDNLSTSLDYYTTVSGEWETLTFNFFGQEAAYDRLVFLFDWGQIGDGSASSTFLFDDIEQVSGPALPEPVAAALPIDFEANVLSTDFVNFFGGFASVMDNPHMDTENPSATVGRFIRSGGAAWAQSKVELTDFMDFSSLSAISMKIYTEAPVGTLLKLKVESTQSGAANEKDVLTTVSGGWATYTWDFAGDPPVYNVLTLMLGYATENDASPSATFFFDDIAQAPGASRIDSHTALIGISAFPNPAVDSFVISSEQEEIIQIRFFDTLGQEVAQSRPYSKTAFIDCRHLEAGMYSAHVITNNGRGTLQVIIK